MPSVEYRWLLFDRATQESRFAAEVNFRRDEVIDGLYCFPSGTVYPRYTFFQDDPSESLAVARIWAEEIAIPMRTAMARDKWEELVRQTAYFAWEAEGCPHGRDVDHWAAAAERLADLLTTEYVFARLDPPLEIADAEGVVDGIDEEDQDVALPEPGDGTPLEGGQGSGDGTSKGVRTKWSITGIAGRWDGRRRAARRSEAKTS